MKNNSTISTQSAGNAIGALELQPIIEHISGLTMSRASGLGILKLYPYKDPEQLKEALTRVTEMRSLLDFDDNLPLSPFNVIENILNKLRVDGAFLQPQEFLLLQGVLISSRRVVQYFEGRQEKYPKLFMDAGSIVPLPEQEREIDRIISPNADVNDSASAELKRIRRAIETKTIQLRRRLESTMRSMKDRGFTQDDQLVLRDGRLVIPMKEHHAGQLRGMVIDQSSSGQTLFIEPLESMETHNDVRRLKIQESKEVERILRDLTIKIREHHPEIADNYKMLIQIDIIYAKARYSVEIHGCEAGICASDEIHLEKARHPLLLFSHPFETVVPLTLDMDPSLNTLIVTGPNAGGKTVTLKTIGLLALMHAYGLHVPAQSGTKIPIFNQIFVDIGDQQSIEQDLSTFSSHVGKLKQIVTESGNSSLVLMDEIGSSTDPAEGAALAMAVLRNLTSRGCKTIATTHMGALKVFAQDETGMENASMAFNHETLEPTYRFQPGIPGSSYAFEIGERYGLPAEILREAKLLLGEDRSNLDHLLMTLQQERERSRALLGELETKESKLSGLIALYTDRLKQLKSDAENEKQKLFQQAEEVLKEANVAMERMVKEIRESKAEKTTIQQVKQELARIKKKATSGKQPRSFTTDRMPVQGDWVKWSGHSGRGKVTSDPDKSKRVFVEWGDIRLRVPLKDLTFLEAPSEPESGPRGMVSFSLSEPVKDEIDLRGMTSVEALDMLERYLGDAAHQGFRSVRIIHGKGTGVLRNEVGHFLKSRKQVKHYRLGQWNEGDTGVTIAELA